VRVISLKKLRLFWERNPSAKKTLQGWYSSLKLSTGESLMDLKKTHRSVDAFKVKSGTTVYIFNVGGNKYRAVVAIHFNRRICFILRIMTHTEYDRDSWKKEL
jgi:mRNA interferase HigB